MKTNKDLSYSPEMIQLVDLEISKYNTRYERIDRQLVELLKQSISSRGYDENFPILVAYIADNDKPEILGGAHRFVACQELELKTIPANVYRDIAVDEAVQISYDNNQNQQTFKPETFLDLAHQIHRIHSEGNKSLDAIGAIFSMSKASAVFHNCVINDLAPDILTKVEETMVTRFGNLVTIDSAGTVTTTDTQVTDIDWKLKWFRYITPLHCEYQRIIIDRIIDNPKSATAKQIQQWASIYKEREALKQFFNGNVPEEFLADYLERVDTAAFDGQITWNKESKEWIISDSLSKTIEQLKQESLSRFETIGLYHNRFQYF